jgi:Fe-S-cluster containining protein
MSEKISSMKKKADDSFNPEQAEWGNCIPECSKCCHGSGKETTLKEAEEISKNLDVPIGHFVDINKHINDMASSKDELPHRLFLRTNDNKCIFLCDCGQCLVYSIKPTVCSKYGSWMSDCKDYRRINELAGKGSDIARKLKSMWLDKRKRKEFNPVKWKVDAELLVEELHRKTGKSNKTKAK